MPSLAGTSIAITEARRGVELATLVAKLGGVPCPAPAVREVPRADEGPALEVIDEIVSGKVAVIVFMTGVGTRAFLDLAARHGRREALLDALRSLLVAARGPKPIAVLKAAGVRVDIVPAEPTSTGLLVALEPHAVEGRLVAVQLHGDDNPTLAEGLRTRGARVLEIPLYEWALPEDLEPLRRLVHAIVGAEVDVVAFTSSPQVRHLFLIADGLGLARELAQALATRVQVASIGSVCTATLAEYGVSRVIQPEKGSMGALVHAIADRIMPRDRHGARSDAQTERA